MKPQINEQYWLDRNPNLIRSYPNKAYYGTYLIRVDLSIIGASMRYHQHNVPLQHKHKGEPTYEQFLRFVKRQSQMFNVHKLLRTVDDRFVHVRRVTLTKNKNNGAEYDDRVYDAQVLYNEYQLLRNKPKDVKISRQMDSLRLYSNNEQSIIKIIDGLGVDDEAIRILGYPEESRIDNLLSGREYSVYASDFKFKVYLRPVEDGGIPALANYVDSIKHTDEIGVPKHTQMAINGTSDRWSWARYTRTYLYARNEDTVLLIKMLAADKFSKAVELVEPDDENDK